MFAASLNTLKKRASELVKGEDSRKKDEELGPPSLEARETLRDLVADVHRGGGVEEPFVVRYEVQSGEDDDREVAIFPLPPPMASGLTVGHVRRHFPVFGRFHFRFKAQTPDSIFTGFVWVDCSNDADLVPAFKGEICMKALRIPDGADDVRVLDSLSGGGYASMSSPSSPMPQPQAGIRPTTSEPLGTLDRSPPAPPPVGQAPVEGMAPAPTVGPPPDLMEMGVPAGGGASAPQRPPPVPAPSAMLGAVGPPSPPAPPPVQLSREELVARRKAQEQAAVDAAIARQAEARTTETQNKAAKVAKNNEINAEMDRWARTGDGQAYKDIKVLLSTMHTVLWPNSGWAELPLSELLDDSKVKKHYRQAILICHPDKQKEACVEQQVRADRIFQALNEAFKLVDSK